MNREFDYRELIPMVNEFEYKYNKLAHIYMPITYKFGLDVNIHLDTSITSPRGNIYKINSSLFMISRKVLVFTTTYTSMIINKFFKILEPITTQINNMIMGIKEFGIRDSMVDLRYENLPDHMFVESFVRNATKSQYVNLNELAKFVEEIQHLATTSRNEFKAVPLFMKIKQLWATEKYGLKIFKFCFEQYLGHVEKDVLHKVNFGEYDHKFKSCMMISLVNYISAILLSTDADKNIYKLLSSDRELLIDIDYYLHIKKEVKPMLHSITDMVEAVGININFRNNQLNILTMLYEHFTKHSICLFKANTGFGKTTLSLILGTLMMGSGKVVIVIKTSNIVPQWKNQFEQLGLDRIYPYFMWTIHENIPECNCPGYATVAGHYGLTSPDAIAYGVANSKFIFIFENRLHNISYMNAELLIYDECHQSLAPGTNSALTNILARNILMISATPGTTIEHLLLNMSPKIFEMTNKTRSYTFEIFDTKFAMNCKPKYLWNFAFGQQFIENNIYYNKVLAYRINEYIKEYNVTHKGRSKAKVLVFVNSIIHAHLLKHYLIMHNVSTTLYIQDDNTCDGHATVMIGTKNKISTGFDQDNSGIGFDRKFNTAVISMVVTKHDMYLQMIGRIMRNHDAEEELRVIYPVNYMSEDAVGTISQFIPEKCRKVNTKSHVSGVLIDLTSVDNDEKLFHGPIPKINSKKDPSEYLVWKSEQNCLITDYTKERSNLIQLYNDTYFMKERDVEGPGFENVCSCNCNTYNYTGFIKNEKEIIESLNFEMSPCLSYCISYLHALFCYTIFINKNTIFNNHNDINVLGYVSYADVLDILYIEIFTISHKSYLLKRSEHKNMSQREIEYLASVQTTKEFIEANDHAHADAKLILEKAKLKNIKSAIADVKAENRTNITTVPIIDINDIFT